MSKLVQLAAVALSLVAGTAHADANKPVAKRAVRRTSPAKTAAPPPEPSPPPVADPVAPAPPPPAPSALRASLLPVDRDAAQPAFERSPRRIVSVTLNPLPVAVGRYGLNVELVPIAHHAIIANAYWQSVQPWVLDQLFPKDVEKGSLPGRFGGEFGYRLYSGRDGASGLFVGPSFVWMPIFYPRVSEDLHAELVPLDAFGGAVDVGAQAIFGSGFTIGAGAGVMALAYTPPRSITPPPGVSAPTFVEPHVLPRLLIAGGWSF